MNGKNRAPHPSYMVDETGKRVSEVLPVEEYEELLEDIAGLAALAERRGEELVGHARVIERLKADTLS